jgi:hypothetical protein
VGGLTRDVSRPDVIHTRCQTYNPDLVGTPSGNLTFVAADLGLRFGVLDRKKDILRRDARRNLDCSDPNGSRPLRWRGGRNTRP